MSDLKKAQRLFQKAGLAFPTIPEELAAQLKEQSKWVYSTRELTTSPYNLGEYVYEDDETAPAYAILAHSGHGSNSYAIQYYLVTGRLRLFLHLGWGGLYADAVEDALQIRECFSLGEQIISAATTALTSGERLTIVGSDLCGSLWSAHRPIRGLNLQNSKRPAEVLIEALAWLTSRPSNWSPPYLGAGCSFEPQSPSRAPRTLGKRTGAGAIIFRGLGPVDK